MSDKVSVRLMEDKDLEPLYAIFSRVLSGGDVFPYPLATTFEEFKAIWLPQDSFSYVAEAGGQICGGYYVKPQWPGRGAHVATATYMVAESARGRGVGLALGQSSLDQARARGYTAMQFNLVISSNKAALALWQKIGFQIVGTIPGGFDHVDLGKVDTHVMHRFL